MAFSLPSRVAVVPGFHKDIDISRSTNATKASENTCDISISITTRRTCFRSSCAYAYVALLTKNEDGGDISTRQSTVSSAILLNIEGSWYRELCQEMVFRVCVCPYTYAASVLTCLSLCLCLCLCPSKNQPF